MTRTKYNAVPTEVDGIRFDSKKEAKRYQDLKLLQRAGEISNLVCDKAILTWKLAVNGFPVCKYEADFSYIEKGHAVIEDCKGMKTAMYRLKKKLMFAIYGIQIRES